MQQTLFSADPASPQGEYVTMPPLPLRAATLYQPWAWLVVHGHKPLENRPKGFFPKNFRGWVWIHAAQPTNKEAKLIASAQATDEWLAALALASQNGFMGMPALDDARMVFGAIIGRVRVAGMLEPPTELPSGWRMAGKFGYVLLDATPLREPVPCRGFQGLWTVPEDILEKLKEKTT